MAGALDLAPDLADRGGELLRGGGDGLDIGAGLSSGGRCDAGGALCATLGELAMPCAESCICVAEPERLRTIPAMVFSKPAIACSTFCPLGEPARLLALLLGAQRFTLGQPVAGNTARSGPSARSRRCGPCRGTARSLSPRVSRVIAPLRSPSGRETRATRLQIVKAPHLQPA